jgi:hypothetical protein
MLWYTVITVLFRCPSSQSADLSEASRICRPYLDVRSRIDPHIQPVTEYLEPYLEKTRPYVNQFQDKVYSPVARISHQQYQSYAAPQVAKAQKFVDEQWSKEVQPRVDLGKLWAQEQYQTYAAPYAAKAKDFAEPYVIIAREEIQEMYESLAPMYQRVAPYVDSAHGNVQYAAAYVYPYVRTAQTNISVFFSRKVWPYVVILYGENVEPQLLKISERLGSYKDSRKLKSSVVHEAEVASSISSAASKASVAASSTSATTSTTTSAPDEEDLRQKIESDLKTWQERFAKAADTGAEDLKGRIQEITTSQVKHQAHTVGSALITQLEEAIQSSVTELKSHINKSISQLPDNADDREEASVYDGLVDSIKSSGNTIRGKALSVRSWKHKYDNETSSLVHAALESTLDVIDNIRDLGLQEIGMRWAYMEGVTYKDWSKYHALKKTFDEWRDHVAPVAKEHDGYKKALQEGDSVQDKAMDLASAAAKELTRLKDVAKWKVIAHDASDDFSTKTMPARVVKGYSDIVGSISASANSVFGSVETKPTPSAAIHQQILDGAQGIASEGSKTIDEAASSLSSMFDDSRAISNSAVSERAPIPVPAAASVEAEAAHVWGGVAAVHVEAKQIVLDDDYENSIVSDKLQDLQDLYQAVFDAAFRHAPTTTQGGIQSVNSIASERYFSAIAAASSMLYGAPEPTGAAEQVASAVSERYAKAVEAASHVIYGSASATLPFHGAAALASVTSAASLRLSEALSQASSYYTDAKIAVGVQDPPLQSQYLSKAKQNYYEAVGFAHDQYGQFVTGASSAVYGTPAPKIESLASAASEAIIGTETPWAESMSAKVSDSYNDLISDLSTRIYGTPTPAAESLYNQATEAAASQYAAFSNIVSELVVGKEPAYTESVYSRLSSAYYTGVASPVLAAASSVSSYASTLFTPPAMIEDVYENISSQLDTAVSSASLQIYGSEKGTYEKATEAAAGGYSSISAKASEAIYGTPAPFVEAAQSSVAGFAFSAQKAVSEAIYGTPTPAYEAAASSVANAYSSATSVAGENAGAAANYVADSLSSVSSRVSKAVYGPEESSWESASSRISSAAASASSRLAILLEQVGDSANEGVKAAASSASSVVQKMKDEL